MSGFNYGDRLQFLEQKVDISNKEVSQILNTLMNTVVNIVETHKLFTAYVESQLTELKEKQNAISGTERSDSTGKEL